MDIGAFLVIGALVLAIVSIIFSFMTIFMYKKDSIKDMDTMSFYSKFAGGLWLANIKYPRF
jgi:hypothetical protein